MGISTHVLDTAEGRPARDIPVTCERIERDDVVHLAAVETNEDGRVPSLVADQDLLPGRYRLRFEIAGYVGEAGRSTIFPCVEVLVDVATAEEHYHVPLLLAGNGYTIYRGS